MAILYPVVLLVVLMMFQISLYWHTSNAVGVAAEEGVNAGQVDGGDPDAARDAALRILDASTRLDAPEVQAEIHGDLLTVSVAADAPRLVGIGRWRVRSVAEGPLERFVPADER